MENKLCDYCQEDRDGYFQMLPRKGNGNAFINWGVFDDWTIEFSGKYHVKAKIKIYFCPMCGRKLKENVLC